MALTIPVPLSEFWDAIPLAFSSTFEPMEAMSVNRTGGGQVLVSSSGQRLWAGSATFGLTHASERRQASAMLNAVRQPGFPFLCYDKKRPYPLADPGGLILGSRPIRILSSSANDLGSVSLIGLPAFYKLTAGDLLGYTYGSNPVRYHLHEIARDEVASDVGKTDLMPVTPFLPTALAIGTPVTLIKPPMVAKYDPDTFDPGQGRNAGVEAGRSFRFVQTLEY